MTALFSDEAAQSVDAGVEIVLEFVEIALILVGDLGGDIALADAIDVLGGHIEGADHGVEGVVDPLHDGAVFAVILGDICTGREMTGGRRLP